MRRVRLLLVAMLATLAFAWMPQTGAQDGSRALFLVAKPGLPDPNFRESVVLVTQDESGETAGVIITQGLWSRLLRMARTITAGRSQ